MGRVNGNLGWDMAWAGSDCLVVILLQAHYPTSGPRSGGCLGGHQRGNETHLHPRRISRRKNPRAASLLGHPASGAPRNRRRLLPLFGPHGRGEGPAFLARLWQRPELKGIPLVMAGPGPVADSYRGRTTPNIRWAGFVRGEEKRRLVAGCRAVLFPCLWPEPLGTVVYEAYEQGRPVLGSNLGGLKDLISDGQTGRLLQPGDDAGWIEAIQQLTRSAEAEPGHGRARASVAQPPRLTRQLEPAVRRNSAADHPLKAPPHLDFSFSNSAMNGFGPPRI